MKPKAVREAVQSVGFDRVACRAGVWVGRRTFFYRHGQSAAELARRVQAAVPGAVVVKTVEHDKRWPAVSFFEVRWTVPVAGAMEVTR